MSVRLHASIVWERNQWERQIPYSSCYTRILREIPFPFPNTVPHAHVSHRRGRKGPHTWCFTCQDAVLRTTSLTWMASVTLSTTVCEYHTQCAYTSAWLVGCVERQLAHLRMAFIHHEQVGASWLVKACGIQGSRLLSWKCGKTHWHFQAGNRELHIPRAT